MKAIEVRDASLAFTSPECPELNEVNLTVETGEIVSIVGPSGCGKSTLLRLIAGVLTPDSGEITVARSTEKTGWSNLSFVPQDSLLLPWRTVVANICLPLELHQSFTQSEILAKARKVLHLVNLTGVETKYPRELSGGMRQRAALARALVGDAAILLLDEPFAALDAFSRNQLHLELLRIQKQTGITILLVTHNIFEAVFLSDKVVVMGEKPGRALGEIRINLPKPRNLKMMSHPEFSRLVGIVQELLETGWGDYDGRQA
ncbi:MAG: ABC transporter ATP-binding protein [Bacteroidota bacterium]